MKYPTRSQADVLHWGSAKKSNLGNNILKNQDQENTKLKVIFKLIRERELQYLLADKSLKIIHCFWLIKVS